MTARSSLGVRILVPLMRAFQRLHPRTHIDLRLDDHFIDLVEGKIDVGVRAGSAPERNLVARRLADIRLAVCASPAYLAEHGAPASMADLAVHRCTGFRQPNSGRLIPWELDVDGATVYHDVPAVVSFNNVEAEVAAVLAGIGIGQLPLYMVDDLLADGRLVTLLPEHDSANLGLYMYYQQRTQMPQRVRNFIDFASASLLWQR